MFRRAKQKIAALISRFSHHVANLAHWFAGVSPSTESPAQAAMAFVAMLAAFWCLLMALILATTPANQ